MLPSRKICRKSSVKECIFDYMAMHIEQKLTPPVLRFRDFAGWVGEREEGGKK